MTQAGEAGVAPLRVGLIGYGLGGRSFHAPLLISTEGISLVAIATSRVEQVRQDLPSVAAVATAADLIGRDDVELVVISTPNASHFPLAMAALEDDKAVVVDKPFTINLDEARRLAAFAGDRHGFLSVFHNRRWDSDFLGVAQAIRGGTIGRVTHFESRIDRFRPVVRDRWRERAGSEGGLWADLGPHLVDQAVCLFGLPRNVQANFATQRPGGQIEDWVHVVLDYGTLHVVLHIDSHAAGGTHRFVVHGDAGSLVKHLPDRQDQQVGEGLRPGHPEWGVDPDPLTHFRPDGTSANLQVPRGDHGQFYKAVRDALRAGRPNPVPSIQAVAVMAILDACAQSARMKEAKSLDLTDHETEAAAAAIAGGAMRNV